MTEGPINPDPEQQRADNIASARQSHIGPGPLPPKASREDADSAKGTGEGTEPDSDESTSRSQPGTD